MKKTMFILCLISILVIFILSYIIIKQNKSLLELKNSIPHMVIGETIDYFDLVCENGITINATVFNQKQKYKYSVIFILSRPCAPCNKNLPFWKKISSIKNVDAYGIMINSKSEMINFSKSMKLNFNLFCPINTKRFRKAFKIKNKLSHTLLIKSRSVLFAKVGELSANDYFKMTKILKGG